LFVSRPSCVVVHPRISPPPRTARYLSTAPAQHDYDSLPKKTRSPIRPRKNTHKNGTNNNMHKGKDTNENKNAKTHGIPCLFPPSLLFLMFFIILTLYNARYHPYSRKKNFN
jgi:hypothetical protein